MVRLTWACMTHTFERIPESYYKLGVTDCQVLYATKWLIASDSNKIHLEKLS